MNEKNLETGGDEDALVERLIRLADQGTEVPPDGSARVKAAVRPLWQRHVRRRTVRRRTAWTAAAAAAALFALFALAMWRSIAPSPNPVGRIALVRGDLQIEKRYDGARPALAGDVLHEGDRLWTGEGGRAALVVSNVSMRLDTGSAVRLLAPRVVALDEGAVYVDSDGESSVEIRTPIGVVRDIGTRFEVRHDDRRTRVRVRDGSVFVVARGDVLRVDRGRELIVEESGSRTDAVDPAASEWGWVLDLSMPFPIDGRSVAAFLGWVEAETGLRIEYADTDAHRIARDSVLHGELGQLRADEAPDLVLPSAGLEAAVEGGVLRVRRAGTNDGRPR